MSKYNEMFYDNSKIESQLEDGEKVIWKGKPDKKAYVLNSCYVLLLFSGGWTIVNVFTSILLLQENISFAAFLEIFFCMAVSTIPIICCISVWRNTLKRWEHIEYMLADNHLVIRSEGGGYIYQKINISDIKQVTYRQAGLDKLLCVGDILVEVNSNGNYGKGVFQVLDIKDSLDLYFRLENRLDDYKAQGNTEKYKNSNNIQSVFTRDF